MIIKSKYILFVFICVYTFISCKSNTQNSDKEGELIYFNENDKVLPQNISYDFIPLETKDDNLIGNIDQIEIVEDRIFVLDSYRSNALYVFGRKGNYIAKVGKHGEGPGEYIYPKNIFFDEKDRKIMVYEPNKSQFLYYDLDTYEYLQTSSSTIRASSRIPLPDNYYAFYKPLTFEKQREKFFLQITDSTYTDTESYHYPADFITSIHLTSQDVFYKANNKNLFHMPYDPVIFEIDTTGIKPLYRIVHSEYEFPPIEYLNSIAKGGVDYTNKLLSSKYIASCSFQDTEDYLSICFIANNKIKTAIYDKNRNKMLDLSDLEDKSKQINISIPFVGTHNGAFIAHIKPDKKTINFFEDKYELSEEDNPLLCFIKIE